MRQVNASRFNRPGVVRASTVFAAIVAIVAGLVGAFLFKKFVLDKPAMAQAQQPTAKAMREITVAAYNIVRCPIQASHMKKIKVTDEEYTAIVKKYQPLHPGSAMLVGDQPLHRVPKEAIHTEEPIFEDELEPLGFPTSVSERLRPGYRAAIVEVPADRAMIQVGDQVDVMATLQHDAFGPGGASTACIASGRVVARWGTIYPLCCPANPNAPTRNFTIEVTPCEFALLELARTLGASFAISVRSRPIGPDGVEPEASPAGFVRPDGMDRDTCNATIKDLERVFNIPPREEKKAATPPAILQVYEGNQMRERIAYQQEDNGSPSPGLQITPNKQVPAAPITPAAGYRGKGH